MKETLMMTEEHILANLAIKLHLSYHPPAEGIHIFSGFTAALRDARTAAGRDELGKKVDHTKYGSWLGAIGYMALLDQIGTCFKPKQQSCETGNSIRNEKSLIELFVNSSLYHARGSFISG
jgi:hypothetical protein